MMHLIEVCVCVCLQDNLKTMVPVLHVCFLHGSYVDWRIISDEFAKSKSRSFFGGFKVTE